MRAGRRIAANRARWARCQCATSREGGSEFGGGAVDFGVTGLEVRSDFGSVGFFPFDFFRFHSIFCSIYFSAFRTRV